REPSKACLKYSERDTLMTPKEEQHWSDKLKDTLGCDHEWQDEVTNPTDASAGDVQAK
ncbi:hypothetical protein P7K49_006132, partial [Saguinus oedipus]